MELDEMKLAWQALDHRLEQQHALNLQMFRDSRLDKAHRGLRPLRLGLIMQIIAGACLMLLFAPFWVAHRDSFHLMLYGLLMHAYGLMFVLSAARNLYLQGQIDYSAPVLEIQRRLTVLRMWRLKEALLYGITGCFIWIPLVLVVFEWLGADVWLNAPSVVWGFIASGVACLALMCGIVRWSRSPGRERLRASLENSSVGRSVHNVQSMLEEILRFEQE